MRLTVFCQFATVNTRMYEMVPAKPVQLQVVNDQFDQRKMDPRTCIQFKCEEPPFFAGECWIHYFSRKQ